MARKRKVVLPPKLNGRRARGEGEREEGLLTPLNNKIPRMPLKRRYFSPGRLYERGISDWAVRLKPLNEAIPERGFEGAEFIPNLPNRMVVELIWPKISKIEEGNTESHYRQALTMRSLSKFWCTFVDQTDVIVNMHCSFILKKTNADKAAAPGRFRHWQPRLVM